MNRKQFISALRTALMQLDDLQSLRHNPLLPLLVSDNTAPGPIALQQLLLDAIESLRQMGGALALRMYEILHYRYVEQLTQKEVAYQLGISERQLRREQGNAIEILADQLWEKLNLSQQDFQQKTGELAEPSPAADITINQEIAWLREGFGTGSSDVSVELDEAVKGAAILARHYRVSVQTRLLPISPQVAVPSSVLRQALLTVLSGAIAQSVGCPLRIEATCSKTDVVITLQQLGAGSEELQADRDLSSLQTASQLLAPFGGHLTIQKARPLRIEVLVPAVGSVPVLVIDDNPDARQLFQRYAENSRFRVIATADCDKAIPLAQSMDAHAIVLDIMMPAVDGWDVLARLRHHPATQYIPIIVCTILPQKELASLLGATAFLQKPVTQQAFLETLDRLTSGLVGQAP